MATRSRVPQEPGLSAQMVRYLDDQERQLTKAKDDLAATITPAQVDTKISAALTSATAALKTELVGDIADQKTELLADIAAKTVGAVVNADTGGTLADAITKINELLQAMRDSGAMES